ncbi:unnamed protein product [Ophioblennius macclurei]
MDKYEKVKKIGEGSFGKAILVKSKVDGHQYVIKEISICGMSSRERQESTKEVAVLANMSHPNIVQYKESFEEGGCLYIVMDYCEGGDLFGKINSQSGVLFKEEQILDWFVQICLALKHVHDRKILHRDIKSQNIFLTKDGTVQLGDFGIARVLNSTVEFARTCIGTPYYLSPEICENKPYNNKSDVWALGCVLYEMCTLKHAFEAGNMKNLVLKIIRGSYPPVSVRYSQDLRSLLAQVFKRKPQERPSVDAILAKPFLCCRIKKFLPQQVIAQEFRHTFLHKQPKVGVAPVPPAQKITNPASKYGVPLTVKKVSHATKRAAERKPAAAHKAAPPPAAPQRRVSQVAEQRKKKEDVVRKKKMEKERQQGEQNSILKAEQMKRYSKEKINRMNQAREQGWKHVLSSSGGSSPEKKCFAGARKSSPGVGAVQSLVLSKRPYEQYHAALDQLAKAPPKEPLGSSAGPPNLNRGAPAGAGPVLPNQHARGPDDGAVRRELHRSVYRQAHVSRHRGQAAAERAGQLEEFLQRKREAMLNKVRAEGQLGIRQNLAVLSGSRVGAGRYRRPKVTREEEEYLACLRQIRLQNFNERQQIKARLRGEKYDSDGSDSQGSSEEAELRRKKHEALKAQANTRAAVLKEQLEKKRREASERERKAWEDHLAVRSMKVVACSPAETPPPPPPLPPPPPPPPPPQPRPSPDAPAPPISLTVALKNVGAMTLKENSPKPEVQSEKKMILRRLNQNLKDQGTLEEVEDSHLEKAEPEPELGPASQQQRPLANGDRKKWEVVELPVLPVGGRSLEETRAAAASAEDRPSSAGNRKKWEAGTPLVVAVAQQTLERTLIATIEKTAGEVIRLADGDDQDARRLQGTVTMGGASSCPDEPNPPPLPPPPPSDPSNVSGEALTSAAHQNVAQSVTPPPRAAETHDQADVESLILEEVPKRASLPLTGVQQAWEQEVQQYRPPGGTNELATHTEKSTESSGSAQPEEQLFLKLCSPAHRRAAALAVLSAQSSVDESSSSLASRSRSVSPLRSKHQKALLVGLSTGMFDANNPKMLRTCSLPDLSRLFSSRQEVTTASGEADGAAGNNLEMEDLDEAAKDEEQSENEDAYDEDLRDIRASMERLLQEEGGAGDFNGNPPQFDGVDQDNGQMVVDEDEDEEEEEEEDEDDEEEDEYDECSNGSPGDEEEGLTNGVGEEEEEEEEEQSNNSHLNEEWHSDESGEEAGGDAQHHDSIFSRLEELRFNLEQQMGFDKFIQAYNKIKAIHEDEDENMDLGSSLVLSILGTQHQHLYPNILHLVMADGAYQEDNDE